MTKILAFSGRKQSGKSTGAQYIESIISHHAIPISYRIYSFADPLKQDICMNILGLTYEQCYGSDEDKNTMTNLVWNGEKLTARRAMEVIGTDIFRHISNNVWVDATISKIQRDGLELAIIPDCRFPNEVDTILKYNGYVIRLGLDPFGSMSNSESALDKNKYDWSKFSCVIDNTDMTVQQKNEQILHFLSDKGILQL
jgi:hypothetical protein